MEVRKTQSTRQERRRRSDEAWHLFAREGGLPDALPPEVLHSWLRCRDLHRLDALQPRPRRHLPEAELDERRLVDDAFRMVAPLLPEFTSRVGASEHVLAYFDAEGYLLTLDGDARAASRAREELDFAPGACWSEDSAGTCGAALALTTGQPSEVLASEHYLAAAHGWSNAATPILVPGSAAPVGVVELTGPWEVHRRQSLELTRAIARAIEERIGAAASVRDEVVRHALRMARDAGDALVAVDVRGRVIAANDAAARRRVVEAQALTPSVRAALAGALRGGARAGSDVEVRIALEGGGAVAISVVRHAGAPVGAVLRVLGGSRAPPGTRTPARRATRYDFESILGRSASFRRAVEQARAAATNDLPVVLSGESGTGKELFAQAIHAGSGRSGGPFVALNCASIPATLIEAELFGHEGGAFTGAARDGKAGRFEDAHGGSIFLDEVSELPLPAQGALLRVLQEREVVRLGGGVPRPVDVRVVAATNKALDTLVQTGLFRRDLYYRLNVLPIAVPPLRERGEDVVLLAGAFLTSAESEVGRSGLSLSAAAVTALRAHPWPGNVRELRNVILRAAATSAGDELGPAELVLERIDAAEPAAAVSPRVARPPRSSRRLVRQDIEEALRECQGNFTRAAAHLGVSRMTLYRWAHRLGIATPRGG